MDEALYTKCVKKITEIYIFRKKNIYSFVCIYVIGFKTIHIRYYGLILALLLIVETLFKFDFSDSL